VLVESIQLPALKPPRVLELILARQRGDSVPP
jgi:hypothetical protein